MTHNLYKDAGIFSAVGKGLKNVFKSPVAKGVAGGLAGLGLGLGISRIGFGGSTDKASVASALVDFAIKAKPSRYSGFTPATRKKAVDELIKNFNSDPDLYIRAKKAVAGLRRNRIV